MAIVLGLEDATLAQGGRTLFAGVSLSLDERDRLALIGRNGAGKTTLLRVIAGALEMDRGRRTVRPSVRVIMLPQEPSIEGFATLRDFALAGPEAPEPHEVDAIADQLGVDLARPAQTASGGERRRAAIARALGSKPDVLLLDEPTNHLDVAAIDWLERWLQRFTGAFIAISHDRMFLSRLTRNTLWLDRGNLRRAEVGFGGFEAWMERAREEEARMAEKLDSKLRQELHWLARGVTARRRRNQGRMERLHAMRAQRRAMLGEAGTAKLALATDDAKTKTVIDAEHVTKRFPAAAGAGERTIIRDFTLRVQRGDRIGIVGANGAGKTTLLRLLTGETRPDEGSVRIAKTVTGILIDQQRRLLEPAKRVRDVLADGGDWIVVRGVKKHVAGYLKEFLFEPELADAMVGTLSGGERSRLLLAREFARESNLLVLDEPTNDLDLETLDLLQEVIADYEGTVLLVSHDRDFLDRTVTLVLGLDGSGRVDVVAGGYSDWEAKRHEPRRPPPARRPAPRSGEGCSAGAGPAPAPAEEGDRAQHGGGTASGGAARRKLSYKDQRALDLLPGEIAALEATIAAHEAALADADLYARNPRRFAELTAALDATRAALAAAEERWLELMEMAEAAG
ncbi:MAG: ABC-F family ATP-binding cassette domain-containing protein [Sphingomonadaceae bacterium]|nr:ABC-F family ATP-binding cassette domain-containing protein [Sphingomonadaceae bacterium]